MTDWEDLQKQARPQLTDTQLTPIDKAKKRQDGIDTKANWFVKCAENHIKYIDKVPHLQTEVLKKTIEMYD